MRSFLIVLILLFALVGCEKVQEEKEIIVDTSPKVSTNTIKNTSTKYIIKKEDIDEKEFIIDSEIDVDGALECNLYFMNDKVYHFDGFGNTVRGEYIISGDMILVKFTNLISEYSERPQDLDVDVRLKMTDENTIEVTETPDSYTIKTSTISGDSWVFDGGEKEMEFLGFVKGYRFYKVPEVSKIDDKKEWVHDANYDADFDAVSYKVEDKEYYEKDIVVPYVNIDSDYAKQVNEEIKKKFDLIVEHYNSGVEDKTSYVDSCKYTFFSEENALFVLFEYGLGATDVVHPVYSTYSFNLVDGSKLDFDYYCNFIGASREEIIDTINKKIETIISEKMNGFDEKEIEKYIEITQNSFAEKFDKGDIMYTVTQEGKPAFVVDIQIPAGSEHFDTIVELY